jgi:4'-phosphopantetheinyl transferase EntD
MISEVNDSAILERWITVALDEMFPRSCKAACRLVTSPMPLLSEAESRAIKLAATKRRIEFAAGRAAARECIANLGVPNAEIPVGIRGMPIWPPGIAGSISHSVGMAVAVAGRTSDICGVGLDIESSGSVHEDLWREILGPEELGYVTSLPQDRRRLVATAFFSIKEAFYKCQFPLTGRWLEFHDVSVSLASDEKRWRLTINHAVPCGGREVLRFNGRYRIGSSLTISTIYL